jgi:transposase
MHAIGIDMSKRSFHAAFDSETVRVFENTEEGMSAFISELERRKFAKDATRIGTEATGAYHLFLCARLREAGWSIVVINPLQASRLIATQSLRKVKTDRKDALAIRTLVENGLGYPYTDTSAVLALKALVVEREGLVELRAMLKHQREAHEAKEHAAGGSLHDSFSPVLSALNAEIKVIERQFKLHELETQALLRSIPGIGLVSAATLVAVIGNADRFSSPEKLVAYVGLDPRVHLSGTSVHGKGFISKRGNARLRHALFNAAFIARQHDPGLKRFFEKKLTEGKHYFSALCAVERKLIHIIWAVWTRKTPFVPTP